MQSYRKEVDYELSELKNQGFRMHKLCSPITEAEKLLEGYRNSRMDVADFLHRPNPEYCPVDFEFIRKGIIILILINVFPL